MTVLVLDNPELLAMPATPDSGVHRPHRLRFHYGFGKHGVDTEDEQLLLGHGQYLAGHPDVIVHLHAHTDGFGQEDYNMFLARLRARAVAKLLKAAGASESQIQISCWGSHKPLARPEDHAANRRVELAYLNESMARAL